MGEEGVRLASVAAPIIAVSANFQKLQGRGGTFFEPEQILNKQTRSQGSPVTVAPHTGEREVRGAKHMNLIASCCVYKDTLRLRSTCVYQPLLIYIYVPEKQSECLLAKSLVLQRKACDR